MYFTEDIDYIIDYIAKKLSTNFDVLDEYEDYGITQKSYVLILDAYEEDVEEFIERLIDNNLSRYLVDEDEDEFFDKDENFEYSITSGVFEMSEDEEDDVEGVEVRLIFWNKYH